MAIGHAFFNTAIGHAYSLNTDIRERSSMVYESFINMELRRDKKHIGIYMYVEKRPYYYYGDQPRLQLVYGVIQTRYMDLHVASSLQYSGVRGMSLLETSSLHLHLQLTTVHTLYSYKAQDIGRSPSFAWQQKELDMPRTKKIPLY